MTTRALVVKFKQSRFILLATILLGVCFFGLAITANVKAEPKLVSSTPAAGEYLAFSDKPVEVKLTFSENLKTEGSSFTITKEDGVDRGVETSSTPFDANAPKQLIKIIPKASSAGANRYIVQYTVTSAVDNSVSAGRYEFFIVPEGKNVFDLNYLFASPSSAFTTDWKGYSYPPLGTIYFFLALLATIASCAMYFYGRYALFSNNRLTFTLVTKASRNLAIVSSLALVFFLCRIGGLQPMNARVFLYAIAIYFIFLLVRGFIYLTRTYPKAKAEWRAQQDRNRAKKPAPAPVIASSNSVSADAGDVSDASKREEARAAIESPRGVSRRGEKRREKKKDRR